MSVAAAEEAVAGVPVANPGAAAAEVSALAVMAPEASIQIQTNLNTPHQLCCIYLSTISMY